MGPAPITLSSIKTYCDIQGITSKERIFHIVEIINAMDAIYLEYIQDDPEEVDDNAD